MQNINTLTRIVDLSQRCNAALGAHDRLLGVILKLQEEMGELATSINIPEKCDEDFRGETADVLSVLLDLYLLLCSIEGQNEFLALDQLNTLMQKKLDKWESWVNTVEDNV